MASQTPPTTMFKLISATPSPYARKVRIALIEKSLPFELITEVPWDSTTQTPKYNPLEKLPVLIPPEPAKPVYESHYILEWLEAKYPDPPLLPPADDVDARLFAKQVEVVCDGICDALVLMFFEKQRASRSSEWEARQLRKVDGGMRALAEWIGDRKFIIGDRLTLADVAAGSVCGYLDVRWPDYPWKERHPQLARYFQGLGSRESFKRTVPSAQKINDKIV